MSSHPHFYCPLLAGIWHVLHDETNPAENSTLAISPAAKTSFLTAADLNGLNGVDTVDVIAAQRFALGLTTGIANAGKYKFTPVSRSYSGIVSDQTGQNYDALVFGDVASPFAH